MLGIGYATPYLGLFREEAERCLAFMPAPQGVVKWPSARPGLAALVDDDELPLADAAVDRVLLGARARNVAATVALCCAKCGACWPRAADCSRWCPTGAVCGRAWTRRPFGHGRPYSRSQITQLLRETWFTPTGWSEALYVPPIARGWFLRSAVAWERAGATISAPFAGVHIVEATKQVYRAIPARRERRGWCRRSSRRSRPRPAAEDSKHSIRALEPRAARWRACRRPAPPLVAAPETRGAATVAAPAPVQRKSVALIVVSRSGRSRCGSGGAAAAGLPARR